MPCRAFRTTIYKVSNYMSLVMAKKSKSIFLTNMDAVSRVFKIWAVSNKVRHEGARARNYLVRKPRMVWLRGGDRISFKTKSVNRKVFLVFLI